MKNPLLAVDWKEGFDELRNLDPSNIGGWSNFVYVTLTVVLFVAIVAAGLQFKVKPIRAEIANAASTEKRLRADFEKKQGKVANLDAYREQLKEMRMSFGSLLRQLPSKTEVANLLNDISQTRVAAGLEEELFQPEADQPREFYAELPNRIEVAGEFHEIANFVSQVSALPRIVTIHKTRLAPHPDKDGLLKMVATAKTYRYLDEEDED